MHTIILKPCRISLLSFLVSLYCMTTIEMSHELILKWSCDCNFTAMSAVHVSINTVHTIISNTIALRTIKLMNSFGQFTILIACDVLKQYAKLFSQFEHIRNTTHFWDSQRHLIVVSHALAVLVTASRKHSR